MKKALLIAVALFTAASSHAVITPISETSSEVSFDFKLSDTMFSSGATETYFFSVFPGTSVELNFKDRFFLFGNLESLETNPDSGVYSFVQNIGELDFSGSYTIGNKLVNWEVDSELYTSLGKDHWKGGFSATASQVPDAGSSLALLGATLLAFFGCRRRFQS